MTQPQLDGDRVLIKQQPMAPMREDLFDLFDLAVRWNCKAGKCGSCSMEINRRPRLACMTRMSLFAPDEPITITPLRTFPVIRDLVTDVSFNFAKAREIPSF